MNYKVICTDIDGTLLDHRRELSDLTIRTFRELPREMEVILASSRMPSAMTHLQQQLGRLNSPLICYNGGYVIHYVNGNLKPDVLYSTIIPVEVCEGIIALTKHTNIHTSLYFEDDWYAPQIDYWSEREARITKVAPTIISLTEVITNWKERKIGAHKVMCMGDEHEMNELEQRLNQLFSNDIHIYRSRPTYLELAPKIISKGSALQLLLEKRFSAALAEVIAFGDNYNDIELLKLAGKGIAVSNARKEVIEIADEVTLDSKADGVALSIQKHREHFNIQ
jgi:Cof subfamily protein (haloacid dehalogenase superfamily)